ncbi:RnfH family protein [Cupriavidus sp. AU9028]|uniref:RnfH family protein n=1 Tax=Cupriavidus sp. AU9028 TaxID=2871157 RepID=UPI001C95F672|nr:RnfH family protein [Cupriavidus sp. AU9028]MBY4897974.1 RnfH family protein [Cupriavidus sp. AU9028]
MRPAEQGGARVHATVCYALPGEAFLRQVEVDAGATIGAALTASGLLQAHPEVDPASARVGIFGKLKTLDTVVREGDRIEVYRPLQADPKTARRRRVQRTREAGTREGQKWMRGGGDTV